MSNTTISPMILTFNSVLWSFHYVVLPICFILGNIGNCFNLLIFSQRSSRANSCLLYFLSATTVNIFILNFNLLLRILRGMWNIDPAAKFLWFCKCKNYFNVTFFLIYRYSILLACIDRMCASSRNARIRMLSQPKVAYRLIIFIWIFLAAFFSPNLVYSDIIFGQCILPTGTPFATFTTVAALFQGILIPSSMITCGLVTLRHLRLMKRQVRPSNTAAAHERTVAGQFIIMLFVQVVTDCLCNIGYPCYLVASLIFPSLPTVENGTINIFLFNILTIVPLLNYSAGFYLHTLSSPTFRRKVLDLLKRILWFQRIFPTNQGNENIQAIPLTTMHASKTGTINRITTQI